MKNKLIPLAFLAIMCIAGAKQAYTQPGKTKMMGKLEKTSIPKVVREKFTIEHPSTLHETWRGYPHFDITNDWYSYNPYVYENEHPEFYIAAYIKNNVHHKVIYSKEGDKLAIYKKTSATLPQRIEEAIKKGAYSTWKIGDEKEEIYRASEMDKMKIYKINVVKGKQQHHLYYSTEGILMKDKTIK